MIFIYWLISNVIIFTDFLTVILFMNPILYDSNTSTHAFKIYREKNT